MLPSIVQPRSLSFRFCRVQTEVHQVQPRSLNFRVFRRSLYTMLEHLKSQVFECSNSSCSQVFELHRYSQESSDEARTPAFFCSDFHFSHARFSNDHACMSHDGVMSRIFSVLIFHLLFLVCLSFAPLRCFIR